jgi:hypothetical protein
MQKTLFGKIVIAFLFATYFYGCTSDTLVPEVPNPNQPVSFTGDIQPIFDQGCNHSGCHATGMVSPDLTPGKSYHALISANLVDTVNPAQSILYNEVKPNGAMSSYCTQAQSQLILLWIQQGAQNN